MSFTPQKHLSLLYFCLFPLPLTIIIQKQYLVEWESQAILINETDFTQKILGLFEKQYVTLRSGHV